MQLRMKGKRAQEDSSASDEEEAGRSDAFQGKAYQLQRQHAVPSSSSPHEQQQPAADYTSRPKKKGRRKPHVQMPTADGLSQAGHT